MISIRLQINSKETVMELQRIIQSQYGLQLLSPEDSEPAHLLILEIENDPRQSFERVHSLLSTGSIREVFLTCASVDPTFLLHAMRSGAKEFLPQPIQEAEVVQALDRFKERIENSGTGAASSKNGKVINVIGSKGGVGNTTIAVNLATSLTNGGRGKSVALIDLNLIFGEVSLFLDIEPTYHWGEIVRNISRLDATFLKSVLHKHDSGVFVLPSPSRPDGSFVLTQDIVERLLWLMRSMFDFIVVDAGNGTDEVFLKILEMSDTVLLVAVQSLPCLTNVSRFLRLFYELGYPTDDVVKIVLNRFMKNADVSLQDVESIGKEIFWTVPNDYKLTMSAIKQGKVFSDIAIRSPVARSIRDLAETFVEKEDDPKKGLSILRKLLRK